MRWQHAAVSGEERCVTSDDPNNGCEGDYMRWQHAAVLTLKHEPCWIAVATVDIHTKTRTSRRF